ncbi:MAG: cation:proton antiporter, partial [Myxococcales bacterium]|nr:cation:proton antiporter [Myxococcales bacterium]
METELGFVALFGVATVVALAARWLKVPYTVALVVAGLVLGSTGAIESVHLTKNLLYAVFLPGLIFEASFHLDFDKFWHNKWTILALAVPGVAASTALAAVLVTPVIHGGGATGFHFEHGLVFAALISATDPIAVVGLFKTMGAPKRLGVLIEGESLLNDGTAVVFFTLALALVGGGELSAGSAAVDFVRVVGVGLLIGAALGYLASKVIQQIDDPMLEITLTTIAAYGSFMAAEHFHFSGVIATVAAGMLCGNYGARTGMSPSTKIAVESFWEYVAFALNSIVFLLVGIEVHVDALVAAWQPIVLAWLVITLARAVVILVVSTVLRGSREKLPWSWTAVMTWGGLRGALSMVLVLGLPETFPHHDTVVNVTFGVVLLSILVQGITMAPLLRRLGVVSAREQRVRYEVQRARLAAVTAALATLRRMEA